MARKDWTKTGKDPEPGRTGSGGRRFAREALTGRDRRHQAFNQTPVRMGANGKLEPVPYQDH